MSGPKKPARTTAIKSYRKNPMGLMKAMGAKNFNPEPPAHPLWVFQNSNCPEERFVAWVKLHTCGRDYMRPYACDTDGVALWVDDAARAMGWELTYTYKVLRTCVMQGRLKVDKPARKILLAGEIEEPEEAAETDEDQVADHKGEETAKLFGLYREISLRLPLYLKELPEKYREKAVASIEAYGEYSTRIDRDAIAAGRAAKESTLESLLRAIGFSKDRHRPRRVEESSVELKVLIVPPAFESIFDAEHSSVQRNAEGVATVPYKPENGSVQASVQAETETASLLPYPYPYSLRPSSSSSSQVQATAAMGLVPRPEGKQETGTALAEDGRAAHSEKPGEAESLKELEFGRALAQAWSETGKPGHPNRNAISETCRLVPAEAREAYLADVAPRMKRKNWQTAGALATDAAEWMHGKWPLVREALARDREAARQRERDRAAEVKRQEKDTAAAVKREALWSRFATLSPEEREPYLARARAALQASARWKLFTPAQQKEQIENRAAGEYCDEREALST